MSMGFDKVRIGFAAAAQRILWILHRAQSAPIQAARFFDVEWYRNAYGVAQNPFEHFLKVGWKRGLNPNPFFDVVWYGLTYRTKRNPLVDYILFGSMGRRNPHPLFDGDWYLRTHKDVASAGVDPLLHFLDLGRYECRSPHPLFDASWYSQNCADHRARTDPFFHYLHLADHAAVDPHPLFDAKWYVHNNPEIRATRTNPLIHFVEKGALDGLDPHPLFGASWYLDTYPDIRRAGVNPLVHYILHGAGERRDPHPHFQTDWYASAYKDIALEEINPLVHFVTSGMAEGRKPNFVFDPAWYLKHYRERIDPTMPAFLHFLRLGRFLEFKPGPFFSPRVFKLHYAANARERNDPTAAFLDRCRRRTSAKPPEICFRLMDVASLASEASTESAPPRKRPFWIQAKRYARKASGFFGGEVRWKATVAVQIHIFYPDMAHIMAGFVRNMPTPFDLFISITDERYRNQIEQAFADIEHVRQITTRTVENRGRDVAPFVVVYGQELERYNLILHLHTKKSPHNSDLSGWLNYLLENLLGSKQTVTAILNNFKDDKNLGILYPATYGPVQPFMRLGGNEKDVRCLLSRLGINFDEVDPLMFSSFPSGSMFWARGEIMSRFKQLRLSVSDFPLENAMHDDGTLAHAVERIVPALALGAGLEIRPFVRGDGDFDPLRGMWRVSESIETDVLIIDHNIGGGANNFARDELKKYVEVWGDRCQALLRYNSWRPNVPTSQGRQNQISHSRRRRHDGGSHR